MIAWNEFEFNANTCRNWWRFALLVTIISFAKYPKILIIFGPSEIITLSAMLPDTKLNIDANASTYLTVGGSYFQRKRHHRARHDISWNQWQTYWIYCLIADTVGILMMEIMNVYIDAGIIHIISLSLESDVCKAGRLHHLSYTHCYHESV